MAVWHQRGLELMRLDVSAVPSLGLRDRRCHRAEGEAREVVVFHLRLTQTSKWRWQVQTDLFYVWTTEQGSARSGVSWWVGLRVGNTGEELKRSPVCPQRGKKISVPRDIGLSQEVEVSPSWTCGRGWLMVSRSALCRACH